MSGETLARAFAMHAQAKADLDARLKAQRERPPLSLDELIETVREARMSDEAKDALVAQVIANTPGARFTVTALRRRMDARKAGAR